MHRDDRFLELIQVVETAGVVAVRTEESLLAGTGKGDAEIIARGIDRIAHVFHPPMPRAILRGAEKVEPAHARMAAGGEIERHRIAHVGEHLVARRVDFRT